MSSFTDPSARLNRRDSDSGGVREEKGSWKTTSKEREHIVQRYLMGQPPSEIANFYPITKPAIEGILRRRGLVRNRSAGNRKYTINEHYFENLNSNDKAYWLGFIGADGCVIGNELIIALQPKDKEHLRKFLHSIESNRPVKKYESPKPWGCVRISIHSDTIVRDLEKYGIVPRKSKKYDWFQPPDSLAPHFIRGYFDGDGCICEYSVSDSRYIKGHVLNHSFTIAATESLLLGIQKCLIKVGLGKTKLSEYKQSKGLFQMSYTGRGNLRKIYRYLYSNATVWLDRKKEKFEEILFGDKIIDGPVENESGIVPLYNF